MSLPLRPDLPCHQCGCEDWWLRDDANAEWLCDRCHPNPADDDIRPRKTRVLYAVPEHETPAVFLYDGGKGEALPA